MAHQFKVGISGAGIIGAIHADALSTLDSAELVAVAEPREEAGAAFVEKYGGTHYTSYPEMLASADIDIVIVATPSGLHPDQVVLAAEHGKHVITEKPMAITQEGLDRMIEATEAANVQLAVIFQNRLSKDVFTVKRALEQGAFGKPILANCVLYWHRDQNYYDANGGWRGTWALDGGGALMNQSIHQVDQLQWMMGGVQEVKAFTSTLNHTIETEDTASAAFVYGNGALGAITVTTCADKDYPFRIEIIGTAGRATLEQNALTLWEANVAPEDVNLTDEDHHLINGWEAGEAWGLSHRRQLRAIFDQLDTGKQPYVSGTEARKPVDVILSIYNDANG
jgi:UDP-N-acetyl-2-amino-2-deoxyglucuronate dehydrogenase